MFPVLLLYFKSTEFFCFATAKHFKSMSLLHSQGNRLTGEPNKTEIKELNNPQTFRKA